MVERAANRYVEAVEELKGNIGKSMGDVDVISTMDSNTFEMLKLSLKVIDTTNELIVEMSKSIDCLHVKLDKLTKQK